MWTWASRVLGPGILFASAAIGVSHLVQSTRAGALFGFDLVGVVVAANVLKYPFFEFGSRYACATGRSILDGYRRQGRWMLGLYLALTLASMFAVAAAVTFVCAGLFAYLFGLDPGAAAAVAAGLLATCAVVLAAGKFGLLDGALKALALVLTLTTLWATGVAVFDWAAGALPAPAPGPDAAPAFSWASLPFLIALMGWMPTAVDLSAWNSLWTVEKMRQTGYRPTLRETLADFHLGYWLSAGLALCFLTLGALLMHGRGVPLADGAVGSAAQLVGLYAEAVGGWVRPVIGVAAATVMLSTVITVLDGYSRSLVETLQLLRTGADAPPADGPRGYVLGVALLAAGSALILLFLAASLTALVDFATTLSFVIAPVFAALNLRVVCAAEVAPEHRPGPWLRALAWAGLAFLTGFSLLFLWTLVR